MKGKKIPFAKNIQFVPSTSMLVLSYWSILFFVLPHFLYTQATKWDVQVCLSQPYHHPISISLNRNDFKNMTCSNKENCFKTEYELDNKTKPRYMHFSPSLILVLKGFVQNNDLQERYVIWWKKKWKYLARLQEWTRWSIEVTHNKAFGNYEYSLKIEPFGEMNVTFRADSKASNKSFFLPMRMNRNLSIRLLTTGKFWLDTNIKLKNMKTTKTYSCVYLRDQFNQISYHECLLVNDSAWKIELTSRSRLIRNITKINAFVGVNGSGTDSLDKLTFKKLAYLPKFSAYTNNGNMTINDIEIYFNDINEAFDLFKIVMTRILTGEEYGCANIKETIPAKYSCRLLQSKNWLLRIISPEEYEQTFFVEIIQGSISSFSRELSWRNVYGHSDFNIKHFNLKMYEDDEVTSLKLHFLNKSLKINNISLINNYKEYRFKVKAESKSKNHLVTEFTQIAKEKIHPDKTFLIMKIVIGILAGLTVILIIIIIISNRLRMMRKSLNKRCTSTRKVTEKRNNYISIQNVKSTHITEPNVELDSQLQDPDDIYENTMLESAAGVRDSAIYETMQ